MRTTQRGPYALHRTNPANSRGLRARYTSDPATQVAKMGIPRNPRTLAVPTRSEAAAVAATRNARAAQVVRRVRASSAGASRPPEPCRTRWRSAKRALRGGQEGGRRPSPSSRPGGASEVRPAVTGAPVGGWGRSRLARAGPDRSSPTLAASRKKREKSAHRGNAGAVGVELFTPALFAWSSSWCCSRRHKPLPEPATHECAEGGG